MTTQATTIGPNRPRVVRFPLTYLERVEMLAEHTGNTKADTIRKALGEYLDKHLPTKQDQN